MIDREPEVTSNPNLSEEPEFGAAPKTPRWVKVFGVAFLIMLLGVGIMFVHGIIAGQGPFDHRSLMGH